MELRRRHQIERNANYSTNGQQQSQRRESDNLPEHIGLSMESSALPYRIPMDHIYLEADSLPDEI